MPTAAFKTLKKGTAKAGSAMRYRGTLCCIACSHVIFGALIPVSLVLDGAEAFLPTMRSYRHGDIRHRGRGAILFRSGSSEATAFDNDTPLGSRSYTSREGVNLPPPPCPKSNPADDLFRTIRGSWPVWLQNWLCESGVLRAVQDGLIYVGIPSLARAYPQAIWDFFHLSTSGIFSGVNAQSSLTKLAYGDHPSQFIDLLEPKSGDAPPNGVVAFVHGGAWGSGQTWMYRLVAMTFLAQNKAVAVIGYRTYPDADVNGQVSDVGRSMEVLARERPDLLDQEGSILIGHSSGAHIGMLHVLETAKKRLDANTLEPVPIKCFVGISGVYCIESHYEFEKGRGVEQISALRVACGPNDKFRHASTAYRLECMVGSDGKEDYVLTDDYGTPVTLDEHFPKLLFVHGVNDDVVPYTQSCDVADCIRSAITSKDKCKEIVIENVGHADTVLHLMVGGKTRDVVSDWLHSHT